MLGRLEGHFQDSDSDFEGLRGAAARHELRDDAFTNAQLAAKVLHLPHGRSSVVR